MFRPYFFLPRFLPWALLLLLPLWAGAQGQGLLELHVRIDHDRLFHPTTGWFMTGPRADRSHWKQPGANFWTRREHPAVVKIIETDGRTVFNDSIGFRLFGGMSRLHPQKSFSLSARKKYGAKKIDYPIFGEDGQEDFRFLVARNGGSDWGRSYLRDAFLTGLLQDESWDLERQAARPCRVYLNGAYWGLYHLREKINVRFLEDRSGFDKDSIDLLEHRRTVKQGGGAAYTSLASTIASCDPSRFTDYSRLQSLMDVDNFMRLQIAQTYFDNRDAGGNIRYWRPRTPHGRWRWIMYDVDQGFGLHQDSMWRNNSLEFFTAADGPLWPNPPWSTLVQRQLLRNEDYRRRFVNRSLDYLQTDFAAPVVEAALDRHIAAVADEMPRHCERWDRNPEFWPVHLDRIRRFARNRPAALREHYRSFFSGGTDRRVKISAGAGGSIVLNENLTLDQPYVGTYFSAFPIDLRAEPKPGYRFVGWNGIEETYREVVLSLDRDYDISARFEPYRHPLAETVVINEVQVKGDDWVKLHNRSDEPVDLRDWLLTDAGGDRYRLPPLRLPPNGYVTLDELPFGLNRFEDRVGLYSRRGGYVDELSWVLDGEQERVQATGMRVDARSFWMRIGVGGFVLLFVGMLAARRATVRSADALP